MFTCEAGSEFVQETGSIVDVEERSMLVIEAGSIYRMDSKSKMKVDRTSRIIVRGKLVLGNGAKLIIRSKSGLVIDGGMVVTEEK